MQLEERGGHGRGAAQSQGQDLTILTTALSCPQVENPPVCRELHWAASPVSNWEEWKRCRGATPGGGIPCSEGRSLQAGALPRPASPDSTWSDFQPHSPAVHPGRVPSQQQAALWGYFFPKTSCQAPRGGGFAAPQLVFSLPPSFVFLGQEQGGAAAGG